jgi:Divergent InlB B-repeat domain
MIATVRSRFINATNALASVACALLGAPAFAGDGAAALLFVPISVNVTPPAATAPVINGSFTFSVTCSANTWTFVAPALTLVANALPAPFVTALVGEAQSSNIALNTSNCAVTQTARPTPPAGFLWSGTPAAVNTGTVSVPSIAPPARALLSTFNNTLVTAIPVTINIVPPNGGTFVCNPNPVPSGERTLCTAAINTAAGFNAVSVASDPAAAATGCTFANDGAYISGNLTAPCTVTVTFTQPTTPISTAVTPVGGGTLACNPNPVATGSTSSCTAAPSTGYTLASIAGCGGSATASPMITAAVNAACTVTATFTLNQYAVTGVASPLAGGAVNCASPINHGSTSICTASANAGYSLTGFSSTCGSAATSASYTTGPVTANCTVTGNFALNTFTVTSVANPVAGGTVTCATPINFNATSSCTATANAGYTLTAISGCGGAATTTSPFTTGPVTANCTVTGNFALNTFTVTSVASPVAGGTVTCASPINFNATSSCTATANAGYTLTAISGCGGAATTTSPFTTGPVTANCTVTASFQALSFPVITSVVAAGGGTLSCTPSVVPFGATTTCAAAASNGFRLVSVSGCGGTTSTTGSFVSGPVTAPCTVTGVFQALAAEAPTVAVPTLNAWLLALLALVSAALGSSMLRTQRRAE